MNTKKLLCTVLALIMAFALVACDAEKAPEETAPAAYVPAVKESAVKTCGEASVTITYVYDADGKCIKEVATDAEGNELNNYFTYNSEGKLGSEIHNNADQTKDKYRHTYKDGLLIKTVHTAPSGSKTTIAYTHNEDGTIAGYTKTFSDKSTQTAVYTYNDLGAVASIECTGVEPSVTTYEYNNHGDVIKETVTVEGVETVTTYEYTYQQ